MPSLNLFNSPKLFLSLLVRLKAHFIYKVSICWSPTCSGVGSCLRSSSKSIPKYSPFYYKLRIIRFINYTCPSKVSAPGTSTPAYTFSYLLFTMRYGFRLLDPKNISSVSYYACNFWYKALLCSLSFSISSLSSF